MRQGDIFRSSVIKESRDAYIRRLNGIYENNLNGSKVDLIRGYGTFTDDGSIEVNGEKYRGKYTLIAVGGYPTIPDLPGAELGTDSDGFFELNKLPKKTVVVGAGYIAVELAGVLGNLGSDTHLLIRYDKVLRTFDETLSTSLTEAMDKGPVNIHKNTQVKSVEKRSDGLLTIKTNTGIIDEVETLIWAVGRTPSTEKLNLDKVGVKTDAKGHVIVDKFQTTSNPSILCVGDAAGKYLLTPVADTAASSAAFNRLFNQRVFELPPYENIATVVFSHPLSWHCWSDRSRSY
ncbi:pyridine nucleotide-disulfide oxidoreductase [Cooperia oncophora]